MNTVNIERIKLARESRGYSQTMLSKKSKKISQVVLSKIEKGAYNVTEEIVNEIATVLDYKPDFFYKQHDVYPLKHFYFRKNLGTGTNTKKIEALINIISSNIRDLLDSVDIEVKVPFIDIYEKRITPSEMARKIRDNFNLPKGPIKNLVKTIESLGVILIFFDFSKELKIDGVSFITPEGVPLIVINNNIPNSRKIFTMAHELGHLIMHYTGMITTEDIDVEKEANIFAAEFLMPELEIKNQLHRLTESELFYMKSYWKVSMQSILYRANFLGCFTPDQYRRWVTKINFRGWRKIEPYEFEIDQPKLLEKLILIHLQELDYEPEDLKSFFGLSDEEFTKFYIQNNANLNFLLPETKDKIKLKIV